MGRFIDLTGRQFGEWTVIRKDFANQRGELYWLCRCSCGKEASVLGVSLRRGYTRSCGCKSLEFFRKSRKKVNQYSVINNVLIGTTLTGEHFYADLEDFEKIREYCWVRFGKDEKMYVIARTESGSNIFMHRLIMNAKENEDVDHINHNGLDNRKCNLRIVSHEKNMQNLRVRSDNKSGVPGVSWDSSRLKWAANLTCGGIHHRLGRFDSFDDAVAARKAAEEKYFGEYSYDNSIAAVPRIDAHTDQIVAAAG